MVKNCVPWFIFIAVLEAPYGISSERPEQTLNSYLPSLSSSLITKPIETLYQAPQSAFNLLHRINPLYYFTASSSSPPNQYVDQITPHTKKFNYVLKSPYPISYNRNIATAEIPEVDPYQHIVTTLPFYDRQKELLNPVNNHVPPNQNDVKLIPMVNNATDAAPTVQLLLPTDMVVKETPNVLVESIGTDFDLLKQDLDQLERSFYKVNFNKLLSISPPGRQENGISFAQSGLFLFIQIMALCTELDAKTVTQIKQSLRLKSTCSEQVRQMRHVIALLPETSDFLKFRWSSRLVLGSRINISEKFQNNIGRVLHVNVNQFNEDVDPEELAERLNQMVEMDSGGSMHDTFEEDELSNGICAVWLTTLYLRARWRSAPTVLNGSRPFYDGDGPPRSVRMIRINDVMRYAQLREWDAEVIEIEYAVPELTILLLVPLGRSLKTLAEMVTTESLHYVYAKMVTKRVAVSLPIYTLRMTLLVPGKLEMMGLSQLVDTTVGAGCESLKLSHAVQRIMFWAEAGRNAFKDDGIEWDETPEVETIVDRPYIYFVRWRNITLLHGNFVL